MGERTFELFLRLGFAIGATFAIVTVAAGASPATPLEMAQNAKVGSLASPYAAEEAAHDPALAAEGHKLYSNFGCPGCHGGGGGGGMCPPITTGVWIYGDADDTLFRLVALGSADLHKQGFSRRGFQNIVAPMPSYGSIIAKPDDLWKIVSWIKIQAYNNVKVGAARSASPQKMGLPEK
jgi:mono/diheme cytochrome c family protein